MRGRQSLPPTGSLTGRVACGREGSVVGWFLLPEAHGLPSPVAALRASSALSPVTTTASRTAALTAFLWTGDGHLQRPAAIFLVIEHLYGGFHLGLAAHGDEGKPFRPAGGAILDHNDV